MGCVFVERGAVGEGHAADRTYAKHDAGCVIINIIFEFIGKAYIYQRCNGANPAARKQPDQIVHPIVLEDGDAIAKRGLSSDAARQRNARSLPPTARR